MQARESLADDLAHAGGRRKLAQRTDHADPPVADLHRPGLDQGPPQLADEERVAAGEVVDRQGELPYLVIEVAAGGAPDEVGDVGTGERVEPHAHDVVGAAQVGERLRQLAWDVHLRVAERRQQQHAPAPARARQVPQEQERPRVGPVAVLEHEQQRPPAAGVREQGGDRRVQPVALGVRVGDDRRRQSANARGEVRQQPGQLACAGAKLGHGVLGALGDAHETVERLDERPVGRRDDRVAGAVEHQRPPLGQIGGELAHEPALAGARLTRQQHDAPLLARGARHQRAQQVELRRAAHERERRGGTERVGQVDPVAHGTDDDSQV